MISDNTNSNLHILLLDTGHDDNVLSEPIFSREAFFVEHSDSLQHTLELLGETEVAVLLIRLGHTVPSSTDVITAVRRVSPKTEVIVIAPAGAVQEMSSISQTGAFDCLLEPIFPEQVLTKVKKAIEYRSLKIERSSLRAQVAMNYSFDNLVGVTEEITQAKKTISRIAPTDIPVLIKGASGTGKSLAAQIIHHHSKRSSHNATVVDCAVLSESLLDSLMFEKQYAARPDKRTDQPTLLEQADTGTLIIENIDRLSLPVQDKLLAFLKDNSINQNSNSSLKLDIRILSTTCRDLDTLISEGKFRRNLLDRLGVITVALPSLSKRTDDIELLADYLLRKIAAGSGHDQLTISQQALELIRQHHWPGNVRELENTLRHAVSLCTTNRLEIDNLMLASSPETVAEYQKGLNKKSFGSRLDENQRALIQKTLVDNNWNFTQTAQDLGIGRTTLWRKVKKYDLKQETVSS